MTVDRIRSRWLRRLVLIPIAPLGLVCQLIVAAYDTVAEWWDCVKDVWRKSYYER